MPYADSDTTANFVCELEIGFLRNILRTFQHKTRVKTVMDLKVLNYGF